MLSSLRAAKRVYLATPYTKHPEGIEYAFLYAAGQLAALYASGVKRIYSPIVHWHTATVLCPYGTLRGLSPDDWFDQNKPEMDLCDVMAIPDQSGAQVDAVPSSIGVAKEREYFLAIGKPVVVYELTRMTFKEAC